MKEEFTEMNLKIEFFEMSDVIVTSGGELSTDSGNQGQEFEE